MLNDETDVHDVFIYTGVYSRDMTQLTIRLQRVGGTATTQSGTGQDVPHRDAVTTSQTGPE